MSIEKSMTSVERETLKQATREEGELLKEGAEFDERGNFVATGTQVRAAKYEMNVELGEERKRAAFQKIRELHLSDQSEVISVNTVDGRRVRGVLSSHHQHSTLDYPELPIYHLNDSGERIDDKTGWSFERIQLSDILDIKKEGVWKNNRIERD